MGCCASNHFLNPQLDTLPAFDFNNLSGQCRVTRVIDGDTFEVVFFLASKDLKIYSKETFKFYLKEKCRLDGVDVAEKSTSKGKQALVHVQKIIQKNSIFDFKTHKRDKYGRILISLSQDGVDLASEMITKNYGYEYHGGKKKII